MGGTIGYNFLVGQTPVSTRVKVLREVETENRFRGTIGLLTVSFPLGGQATRHRRNRSRPSSERP